MAPYGIELRARIVEAHSNGEGSIRELAERFAVSPNTVQNYLTLYQTTGSIAPRPHGGGVPPKIDKQGLQQVRALLDEAPDATVDELADEFSRRHHIAVGRSTMDRALHRLGVTRKKTLHATERDTAACMEARRAFTEQIAQVPPQLMGVGNRESVCTGYPHSGGDHGTVYKAH
jgi:transposase